MHIEEIGAFEAKTRLSELLERVSRGQIYRITKRGKPIAELRPIEGATGRPRFGSDRGRVVIAEDFDAPLPEMREFMIRDSRSEAKSPRSWSKAAVPYQSS
jgi:prevent-host-death family protein